MSRGDGLTGKFGTAFHTSAAGTKVCDLMEWTFEDAYAIAKYVTNCTGGRKDGAVGAGDSKGTIKVAVPKTAGRKLPLAVGVKYDLFLHVDASGSNYVAVTGIIATLPISCVLEGTEVIAVTYAFEGVGAVTYAGTLAQGYSPCCNEPTSSSGA